MTQKSYDFGREGEDTAVGFLKKQGYRILQRNFRTKAGEIDIVAEKNNVLVFIEVKTRSDHQFGHPIEALTAHKQRKIGQIARGFLAKNQIQGKPVRFDVVAISGAVDTPGSWKVELFTDAFRF